MFHYAVQRENLIQPLPRAGKGCTRQCTNCPTKTLGGGVAEDRTRGFPVCSEPHRASL